MSDLKKVISDLEKVFESFLLETTIKLEHRLYGVFEIRGNNISKAINNIRNDRKEINVLKWFDDFWLHFIIYFTKKENSEFDIFLSLSVFQGRSNDNIKTQLFRAEWDNYEENFSHPQPHWHIYPSNVEQKQIDNFNKYVEENRDYGFKEFVEKEGYDIINLSDFHFAMNGQWINKVGHIHKIDDPNLLKDWLGGILAHIKEQIIYIVK